VKNGQKQVKFNQGKAQILKNEQNQRQGGFKVGFSTDSLGGTNK